MRLDQERSERPDHRAYGRGPDAHSLRPGPLRLPPRVQRAVLQSAAPAIRTNRRPWRSIVSQVAKQAVEDTPAGIGRLGIPQVAWENRRRTILLAPQQRNRGERGLYQRRSTWDERRRRRREGILACPSARVAWHLPGQVRPLQDSRDGAILSGFASIFVGADSMIAAYCYVVDHDHSTCRQNNTVSLA